MNFNDLSIKRSLIAAEILIIVVLAAVPLFVTFPYRVNIFLSWEGAYRISQGELPFKDFGTPLGGMYWVIPGLFFKIFGTQMITLVKAQVFINILSGLAFRSILKSLSVETGLRIVCVLLFCLSYSFFNFWPWYNHTVIVYELIGIAFLLQYIKFSEKRLSFLFVIGAAFFTCCSFLTKQDAGGMAFVLSLMLIGYAGIIKRKWLPILIYVFSFGLILLLFISPFLQYKFGYWFNHGQAPHSSRISIKEIIDEFFTGSQWIKFYLFLIMILLFIKYKSWKNFFNDQKNFIFLLLTIGMLGQAAVFQVTSYTPPDNNIFFHSFGIAYILFLLKEMYTIEFSKMKVVAVFAAGILLWWSGVYWKYIQRVTDRLFPAEIVDYSKAPENVVNKSTYMIRPVDSLDIPVASWVFSDLKSFHKIYMPASTADGMKRLLAMPLVKEGKELNVLNLTELTPLAVEIPYKTHAGPQFPLWHHLGVGMFNKQAAMFETSIAKKEYDLVLFEYVPSLNNFFPFRIRDTLMNHYQKVDSFIAPRRGDTGGMIEVYIK